VDNFRRCGQLTITDTGQSGDVRIVGAMTKTSRYTGLIDLSAAVAPVRERYRELIDAAIAWQHDRERQTDPDHYALICAGAEHDGEVTATRWTRTGTYGVVRCGIPNWCSSHRCLWPEEILHAVWDWFDFLHDTGRMEPGSDPVAELRKPLTCYGGLDQDGRPLDGAPRQVECECFLPYRETTALLNELVQQTERSGEDPLDPLRRAAGRPARAPGRWAWDDDPDDPEYGISWTASGP
jgi:hypothetical protein